MVKDLAAVTEGFHYSERWNSSEGPSVKSGRVVSQDEAIRLFLNCLFWKRAFMFESTPGPDVLKPVD